MTMNHRLTVNKARQAVAKSADGRYGVLLQHGTLELGYYKPQKIDPQQPHDQDEIYFVHSGSGTFVIGDQCRPFEAGEALFVRAGVAHRFEDFSDDFEAWVMLYGPRVGAPE